LPVQLKVAAMAGYIPRLHLTEDHPLAVTGLGSIMGVGTGPADPAAAGPII